MYKFCMLILNFIYLKVDKNMFIVFNYMYVLVCEYVHMNEGAHTGQGFWKP